MRNPNKLSLYFPSSHRLEYKYSAYGDVRGDVGPSSTHFSRKNSDFDRERHAVFFVISETSHNISCGIIFEYGLYSW